MHSSTAGRAAGLTLALIIAIGGCSPGAEDEKRTAEPRKRPNILLIITDDQRIGSLSVMPKLRSWFRRRGTEFKPGFVTTPMCCPSRASIFSGRYMHNHGVLTNLDGHELDTDHTVQAYLQEAGYTTALVGKYLNAWPLDEDPPNFDYFAVSKGFPYGPADWNINGRSRRIKTYSTSFIARRALDFLSTAGASEPWFLTISTIAPHRPALPDSRYARAEVADWKGNPAVFEDLADKPPWLRGPPGNLQRSNVENKLRTLMSVDDLVGRVERRLDDSGQIGDTLALFISDNGILWQEHGMSNKTVPYTSSIQVPFFMTWPGRVPVGPDDRMALNVDIAPTIMDAVGIEPGSSIPMDGRSLLESWRRTEIFLEYHHYSPFPTPSWTSIRTRKEQYVEYRSEDGKVIFEEFYDLEEDPWQLENALADGDAAAPEAVSRLRRRLAAYRDCTGDDCP